MRSIGRTFDHGTSPGRAARLPTAAVGPAAVRLRDGGSGDGVRPLVIASESAVLRQVLAVAAAASVDPVVLADPAAAVRCWRSAALVLVAADRAESLVRLGLPRRSEVFLVGGADQRDLLDHWSGPLGGAVVLFPDGAAWLTTVLADSAGRVAAAGSVITVVGGSGGVGASTFAAALSVGAAAAGWTTLLVDLDPAAGGLDLLMGAEAQPGWRWSRLHGARGHVSDLTDHLPRVAEVALLTADRGVGQIDPPAPAVRSVLGSAARLLDIVVVDVPRGLGPGADQALACSDRVVVVTGAEVRAVAATRSLLDRLTADGHDPGLVVRGARSALPAERVAEALDAPLLAVCPDDPGVRRSEASGEPPGRALRSPLARAAAAVLADRADW